MCPHASQRKKSVLVTLKKMGFGHVTKYSPTRMLPRDQNPFFRVTAKKNGKIERNKNMLKKQVLLRST
jgi:hypothetical protein